MLKSILVLFFMLLPSRSDGTTTNIWRQSTGLEFNKGASRNISVHSSGSIHLSQKTDPIKGIECAFVWSLATDSQKQVFAGTGDPGAIYLIKEGTEAVEVLKSPELYIQSLVVDKNGNLYAGTSPRGIIYKVTGGTGETAVFCSLPAQYIWDMEIDSDSNLIVATGTEGILFKISPDGAPSVFFDSPETNLLDIVLDKQNTVYAGTEPNGLIYKITPSGQAQVIYDAPEGEIHRLTIDSSNNLYAGTASGAQIQIPAAPAPPQPPLQAEAVTPIFKEGETWDLNLPDVLPLIQTVSVPQQKAAAKDTGKISQLKGMPGVSNYIYKITKEGFITRIFEASQAFILGLSTDTKNNLYAVTGNESGVYKVFDDETSNRLTDIEEVQALCCLNTPDDNLYIGTGNVGRVYKISPFFEKEGTFISLILDTAVSSDWGCINWESTQPEGTAITLATRSGNCEKPDTTWSNWSDFYTIPGGKITSPAARFIQYKARLQTAHTDVTPSLNTVSISYLPQNQPPNIIGFEIEKEPYSAARKAPDARSGDKMESKPQTHATQKQHHQIAQKNIKWETEDPNDDNLQLTIHYKGIDEKTWKVLDKNTQKKGNYTWDTLRLPDGKYQIKLVVSDSPDNPTETSFEVENTLQPVVIDNTKPIFQLITTGDTSEGNGIISGSVKDSHSAIIRVQYTIDGRDWVSAYPVDGIFDSLEESFQITLKQIPKGNYTIILNAFDSEGNIAAEKIPFEVN